MTTIRRYLITIALAVSPLSIVSAQSVSGMDVVGTMTATFDNAPREWVTVTGKADGETFASAQWGRITFGAPDFSQAMEQMVEFLPPEARAQLEMLQNMNAENNPMAAMLSQMAGQSVQNADNFEVVISGHDPSGSTSIMEKSLTLSVHIDDIGAATGRSLPAELTYVAETDGGMPRIVYVSSDEDDGAAVTFDQLSIGSGDGHAVGRFQGSMCRMDMRKLMDGLDLSDCINVSGTFDTALAEETPS